DRRYGVLKLLGATPLSRWGLVAARTIAVLCVEAIQVLVICSVATLLGWRPHGNPLAVALLLVLGTAAFSALGLALAGVLRAEATLAVANGIYLLLLIAGGTIIPPDRMPDWLGTIATLLPSGALADPLRDILVSGATLAWAPVGVLAAWAVL